MTLPSPAARELAQRRARILRFVRPFQEFVETESSGGFVLVGAAALAVLWANSPWSAQYHDLLGTEIVVDLTLLRVSESLHFWINDVAMVLFFFLVGMEIKRELVIGELDTPARIAVPVAAALGGMLVPIALFLLLAQGADARVGWGIPMATDIAFALGVIALVGRRAPRGLVALLLAIAIFDDIGSVLVIAVFYTETLDLGALSIAIGLIALVVVMRQTGVRAVTLYALVGVAAWAAVLKSGVHPTLVGVTLGLLTPWKSWYDTAGFTEVADGILDRFRLGLASPSAALGREQQRDALLTLSDLSRESVAPLDRLEHELHPWVAFGVVPLFAWANAGVSLGGETLAAAFDSPLTWAVMLALVLGKPAGIVLGAAIALRAGARRPFGVTRTGCSGSGVLAGVGFTVSLFVTEQAFQDPVLLSQAKMGILAASLLSGVGGYVILRLGRMQGGRAS